MHGPLYSLLLHGWCALAGDGEWALRFPSALFGAALVPVMAWLARLWLGREAAAPAAWLTAASPFLIWYSQEARNYALLMLAATLSTAILLSLGERAGRGAVAGYVAASVVALLSNLSFLLLAPLHLAGWLAPGAARAARRRLLVAAAVILALAAAPWLPRIASTWDWGRLNPARAAPADEAPLRGTTTFHAAAVPFAAYTFAVGSTLAPPLRDLKRRGVEAVLEDYRLVLGAALAFGLLGLLGLRGVVRRRKLLGLVLWVGPPLLAVSYFAIMNFKVFNPRYLAVVQPAFVLVLAAAFADERPGRRAIAALVPGLIWGLSLYHHYFDPRFGKEDYRGALAAVRAAARPGDVLVAVGADHPVVYYNRALLPCRTFWLGFVRWPERLDAEFDRARAGGPAAWVVLSRPEDLDPGGAFARRMGERFPAAEHRQFEGIEVWRVPDGTAVPPPPGP